MIKLAKLLLEHLESIHPRVYFQDASKKAAPPYLVFDFPNTLDDGEGMKVVTVDIDGWDTSDTTALEALMESINAALNKKTLASDELTATFFLETILSLNEEKEPRIRRWKYVYQARLFERG